MRRPIALLCTAACAILVSSPVPASAVEIHQKHYVDRGPLVREVERVIHVAPTDSDDDGVANRKDDCPKEAGPVDGCPPEPPIDASSVSTAAPATSSVATSSAGGCPSYMAGEASTPTTYNAQGSGAAGCFQVMPGTAVAHGCAVDQTTVPVSEQVVCAQRICATSGDGAWVSADPCAYLGTEP